MSNMGGRLDRVGFLMAEAEAERLRKEREENDILPIVLEVLDNHPEAKAELIKRLEALGPPPIRHVWREEEALEDLSDDELERRARAILERRDRERAEGKL